jgi:hypothetical protein
MLGWFVGVVGPLIGGGEYGICMRGGAGDCCRLRPGCGARASCCVWFIADVPFLLACQIYALVGEARSSAHLGVRSPPLSTW